MAVQHYKALEKNASDCIQCGHCESRCPFQLKQSQRMIEISKYMVTRLEKLIDINAYPVSVCLKKLLKDKTTGGNIIWATDAYSAEGTGFADTDEVKEYAIRSREDLIKPRIDKSDDGSAR